MNHLNQSRQFTWYKRVQSETNLVSHLCRECLYASPRPGITHLALLMIPGGGSKMTLLRARGDNQHHENKIVGPVIQDLKLGR